MLLPETTRRLATSAIVMILVTAAFQASGHTGALLENDWLPPLVAGSYVLPYLGLNWLYEKFLWRWLHRGAWLQGYWHMVNTHDDGSSTEGVFELVQSADRVDLRQGMNTSCRGDDRYLAEFWSTAGKLRIAPPDAPNDVVFDFGYLVRRTRTGGTTTHQHAHETLTAHCEGTSMHPNRLDGVFESGASYAPLQPGRATGRSVSTRISERAFSEAKAKHDSLRRDVLGHG